jgi:creatinine amidohydrolase
MARAPKASRLVGELTYPEITQHLSKTSILCLPLGAIEQHGAHLPLNTDAIVAEGISRHLIARWGEAFDLWQLPLVTLGLSREHDWAAGTMSLSIAVFVTLLRELAREIVRALPARNLAIVNGHGGNRGILENLLHELRGDFSLNGCVIHPFDLCKAPADATATTSANPIGAIPVDVHAGRSETSVMLALAPDLVRRDLVAQAEHMGDPEAVRGLIFDRGATFPWRSDDRRLARGGIIGDARGATPELGEAIIASVVEGARGVLARLLEQQGSMRGAG